MGMTVSIDISDADIKAIIIALDEAGYSSSREKVTEAQEERKKELENEAIRLARLATVAGGREALGYATGRIVPTTISDIRAYRIYSLLHAGLGLEEAEEVLPALFKVPASSSRTFMRNAVARFAIELSGEVRQAIINTLKQYKPAGEKWQITVRSSIVHDWITDQIRLATFPDPESRKRGALWFFSTESFNYLRKLVGLPEVP